MSNTLDGNIYSQLHSCRGSGRLCESRLHFERGTRGGAFMKSLLGRQSAGWSGPAGMVVAGLVLAVSLAPSVGRAQSTAALPVVPSVKIVRGELISPSTADAWYATQPQTVSDGLCRDYGSNADICPGGVRPRAPEIKELARALRGDPNLIYEFVRNSVDTEFLFGSHKGALGVIIDHSGTAFDQAELMVELLRESGITARFKYGTLTLTGAQFLAWTGISNAKAACDFLATGGIPATVSSCDAGGSVSSVTLSHIWVEADIGGSARFFDPSYKPYEHKTGIDVRAGMGFVSGEVAAAAGGADQATGTSGVTSLGQLDSVALSTKLGVYSQALLTRMNQSDLQGAGLIDVIGGRLIAPAARPTGGWLQAQPSNYTTTQTWSCSGSPGAGSAICSLPDRYRAKVKFYSLIPALGAAPAETYIDATFFANEIYGRRLESSVTTTGEIPTLTWKPVLGFDRVPLVVGPARTSAAPISITLDITADHPFAAPAGGVSGNYGDAIVRKPFSSLNPATILIGWGATSPALVAKWESEQAFDTSGVVTSFTPLSEIGELFTGSGDLLRARLGATWLAQLSMAADIQSQLANARPVMLHSVGVISTEQSIAQIPQTPWEPGQEIAGESVGFNAMDEVTVIDIESSFGVVSRSSDAVARRSAVQAIAATAASLEGSVLAQFTDSPDASSTASRLAWGNNPETGETPSTSSRPVYRFATPASATNALAFTSYDGGVGAVAAYNRVPLISAPTVDFMRGRLADTIKAYADAGFDVVASSEASLGPGHRIGSEYPDFIYTVQRQTLGPLIVSNYFCSAGPRESWRLAGYDEPGFSDPYDSDWNLFYGCITPSGSRGHWEYELTGSISPGDTVTRTITSYARLPTLQRGGALIATKYDPANPDEPLEIANILTRQGRPTKGGGGPSITQVTAYSPAEAAQTLKDRFVDRSSALGVDLSSGQAGFTSPVIASVGPGEFPYRLDHSWSLRGGKVTNIPAYALETGFTATSVGRMSDGPIGNWQIGADISNSGFEAMGQSRIQAAAPTLVSFVAMQDLWGTLPRSARREVTGALVADWWADRLLFNVATIQQGGGTQQFVRLTDGSFLPTSGGGARLVMTGDRQLVRPDFIQQVRASGTHQEDSVLRGWDYDGISFVLTDASGGQQSFQYWNGSMPPPPGKVTIDTARGWRLNTWTLPNGLRFTLTYDSVPVSGGPSLPTNIPTSVSSSLGYSLTLPVGNRWPYDAPPSPTGPCGILLTATDPMGGVTSVELREPLLRTPTQRPDPTCRPLRIFTPGDQVVASLEYTYDSLGRVKEARDGVAIRTPLVRGPHFFYIADGYRGERQDPEGGRYAVERLQGGRLVRSSDELDRLITSLFDGRGRVLTRTYPEGDREEFTYDARDNTITLTSYPKPGSPLAPLVSSVAFMEGPTVITCSNPKTCNSPATSNGPRTDVTDVTTYGWSATSGALTQIIKPTVTAGTPQIDFTYTSYTANGATFWLMTGKTEKISASVSVTTTFEYDAANNYLLKSSTVDPTGLNLKTCYQYNAAGDLVGVSDPRTTTCPATIQ
jgi:YD repeat-containing protein